MKRLFTNIILFTVTLSAFGQQTFGFKINAGLSYLKTERVTYPPMPETQKFLFQLFRSRRTDIQLQF